MYMQQSSYRFVAYCRTDTIAGDAIPSILDETVNSLAEGHRRVRDMIRTAKSKHGEQLMWIELQELGRSGWWDAVGRFYPESSE